MQWLRSRFFFCELALRRIADTFPLRMAGRAFRCDYPWDRAGQSTTNGFSHRQNRVSEMWEEPGFHLQMARFCTVCQMGVVIVQQEKSRTLPRADGDDSLHYELLEHGSQPNYANHVSYTSGAAAKSNVTAFGVAAARAIAVGLCQAYGRSTFPSCSTALADHAIRLAERSAVGRWRRFLQRLEPRVLGGWVATG